MNTISQKEYLEMQMRIAENHVRANHMLLVAYFAKEVVDDLLKYNKIKVEE